MDGRGDARSGAGARTREEMMRVMRYLALLLVLGWAWPLHAAAPDPAFHLYLLIGQSNMAGRGKLEEQDKQPHAQVFIKLRLKKQIPINSSGCRPATRNCPPPFALRSVIRTIRSS